MAHDESSETLLRPAMCNPPMVAAEGGRYIAVTPQPAAGATPVALLVTSPNYAGVNHHIEADGTLGCGAVYQTPDAWGAPATPGIVHLHDRLVVPSTVYTVQADCGGGLVSSPVTVTTWAWGDVNNANGVNLDDILCELNGFAGNFTVACTRYGDDQQGIEPNGAIDLDDILAVLAAFSGGVYPHALPPTYPVVPTPVLDPHTTMTSQPLVPISGTAVGAIMVEWSSHTGVFTVPVNAMTGAFSANVTLALNRVNPVYFTAIGPCGERSAPSATIITHDGESPNLFIDFPTDGASLTIASTDVAGRVGDILSGFMGLTVKVNCPACPPSGIDAIVDVGIGNNGTFNAANVPLNLGANAITAVATDALGNQTTKQITINRADIPPNTPQMIVVSGNGQTAPVHQFLPQPITVKVLKADGSPFVNKVVTFHVTRSDGRLVGEMTANCYGEGTMMLQCHTDAAGEVRAMWKLGTEAGFGNNRVEVSSTSIAGTVAFCASAIPGPASQINLGAGFDQRVETGTTAPEPLRAWVSDSCNGIANLGVTFTVMQGGGKVKDPAGSTWLDTVTVQTGDTGHAEVDFQAGPIAGTELVQADFAGNPNSPATFVMYALARDVSQLTSFSGLLFDNALQPIGGAECRLVVAGRPVLTTTTNIQGQFSFANVDGSGASDFFVDGAPATTVNGQVVSTGTFPFLHFTLVLVPNAANSLPAPVLLPPLEPCNQIIYDGSQDVTLTVRRRDPAMPGCDPQAPGCCIPAIEGLEMLVSAGTTVRRPDGKCVGPDVSCSGPDDLGQITLALNQVHHDDVPMPMPDGAAPPFAWTLQPGGSTFDIPIRITYPNMSALPAGSIANFLSFDHDANKFQIIASGHVTDDGSSIVTDTNAGLSKAGWGCNCPPYSVTGDCCGNVTVDNEVGTWQLSANEQNATPDTEGKFYIRNIPAPDQFGPGGPGSAPDFMSDDPVRVYGSRTVNGATAYAFSDAFRMGQGQTFVLGDLTITSVPPPATASLALFRRFASILELGETLQLTAIATLQDGSTLDVTPHTAYTTYRTSNPSFATVGQDGLVTANGVGTAFITATNEGASVVKRITVTPMVINTTVEGFVILTNGTPVQNAEVTTTTPFGTTVLTGSDGQFAMPLSLTLAIDTVTVRVTATVGADQLSGLSSELAVVSNGITDAGQIALTPPFNGPLFYGPQWPAGTSPASVSMADVNGDGTPDMIVANGSDPGVISVRLNNGGGNFGPVSSYGVGQNPYSVPAADLDGDSDMDVVTANFEDNTVSVLMNNGNGTFATHAAYAVGFFPRSVTIAELNGDKRPDLLVVNQGGSNVSVLINSGTGTFGSPDFYNVMDDPYSVAAVDLDGDNDKDLAVVGAGAFITILKNNGNGIFVPFVSYPSDSSFSITAADLDGDGDKDLAVALVTNSVLVRLNNGNGSFAAAMTFSVGTSPYFLTASDMDSDGDIDLATANNGANTVSMLRNNGNATFAAHVQYAVGPEPWWITAADVDGDLDSDLAIANHGAASETVSVLLNDGSGAFPLPPQYGVGLNPQAITSADLDEDNDMDLAVANRSGNSISVLSNNGDGTFATHAQYSVGSSPNSIASADLNGDNFTDLAVANFNNSGSVSVLLNNGNGTFAPHVEHGTFNNPRWVTASDLDNDLDMDLIVAVTTGGYVALLFNNEDATFAPQVQYSVNFPSQVATADLDDDGDSDLMVTNGNLVVFLNNGDTTFAPPVEYTSGNNGFAFPTSADLDGDDLLDIAVSGSNNQVFVLLNDGGGTFVGPYPQYGVGNAPFSIVAADLNADTRVDLVAANYGAATVSVLINSDNEATFIPEVRFAVKTSPTSVTAADLDGDAEIDLAITNEGPDTVSVLLNRRVPNN